MTIITLPHTTTEGATPPQRMSTEAAGLDLAITTAVTIPVNGVVMAGTGIAVSLPEGTHGQVHGRSSLAVRHGLTLANNVGIIDSDYTGEIMLALRNLGNERVHLEAGTRVAQLIVVAHLNVVPVEVQHLNATQRGAGGFGSTGQGEES